MDQTITNGKEIHCYVKLVVNVIAICSVAKIQNKNWRVIYFEQDVLQKSWIYHRDKQVEETKTFLQYLSISYQVKNYSENTRQLRNVTMQKLSY